ncbi:hypothetical protein LTR53_010615 [Teratosphaeriaceae sp. CCFEE 6253]|nr:hypothetical protein LTR53_010615 [Teratosphaeriaceae sp. CCFEE 6253]
MTIRRSSPRRLQDHGEQTGAMLRVGDASAATFQLLHRLPEELLLDILERLERPDQECLQLTSRWGYRVATPLRWREVELVDCRTHYDDSVDEHDDTPLIKILLLLARKPDLAACVQVVTHRCHLPPPAIFMELPKMPFSSHTLSTDLRTICLVKHAVRNMTRVHTLRIIFGHPNLNDALLRCFFDKRRLKSNPVRRLWLENCRFTAGCNISLDEHPHGLPLELDFDGLESVRFRRLPMRPGRPWRTGDYPGYGLVYSRGTLLPRSEVLHDGVGGRYSTTMNLLGAEQSVHRQHRTRLEDPALEADERAALEVVPPLSQLFREATLYDRRIWDGLREQDIVSLDDVALLREAQLPPNVMRSEIAYRGECLDPLNFEHIDAPAAWKRAQREKLPSPDVAFDLCSSASSSLRSLTLDWVLTSPTQGVHQDGREHQRWLDIFLGLSSLRLPHLRAFQFRNAVIEGTRLPAGLYLLDHVGPEIRNDGSSDPVALDLDATQVERLGTACLEFLEAHPSLECLAWPMQHFFSERGMPTSPEIASRVTIVIANLGRTLVDLRVDTRYAGNGEPQSEDWTCPNLADRERRRRFIELFASQMTKLKSIKIEGGIPRDERREIIRALHACPLEKVVMIGVCTPLGNTWGAEGRDIPEPLDSIDIEALEGEDKDSIWRYGPINPDSLPTNFRFDASYGWPPGPPMLHTIAAYHASTITELKFCGYKGAPVLHGPTPITTPILSALKHFHNLKSLVMSLWLTTSFENDTHDSEIVAYWLNTRSPASTALVRITDDEPEGWEKEIRTKYAPDALAGRVTSFLGPFLSEQAKARKGGVNVRASFCVGEEGGIFDLDLDIGTGALGSSVCLGFKGPHEELARDRRKSKLDRRRWF